MHNRSGGVVVASLSAPHMYAKKRTCVRQLTFVSLDQRNYASGGAFAQEAHMAACPFTKTTEIQNFGTQSDPVWRSCARGRIAVERIGHSRHWRGLPVLHTPPPPLTLSTPRRTLVCKNFERPEYRRAF